MFNPWKILGVHRKSEDADIRDAFIVMAKRHHPDVNDKRKKPDPEMFGLANQAYKILKDNKSRNEFIERIKVTTRPCAVCLGTGVKSKSKGFHQKSYTGCLACDGSGFMFKKGEENVTIELGRTDGVGGKRRNNKRRS